MTLVGLLLSPLMPPWLLVWPLAMVPLLPAGAGLTALVWAATATLSYATGPHLPLLELVPVYAAGGVELIVFARSGQRPRLAVATVPG